MLLLIVMYLCAIYMAQIDNVLIFPMIFGSVKIHFFLMLSNALLIKVCMLIKAEANVN